MNRHGWSTFWLLALVGTIGLGLTIERTVAAPVFEKATAIWPEERSLEKNLTVGFRADFEVEAGAKVLVRLTGSTLYRGFLNGEFCGHGPARAGHGHYRVDEWDLSDRVEAGRNVIGIEVAGYNVNSYYLLDQPSFLQAEVLVNGRPVVWTGGAGWIATPLEQRLQRVQRYSFQRPFIEVYRMDSADGGWLSPEAGREGLACAPADGIKLLPRNVPYPEYRMITPIAQVAAGAMKRLDRVEQPWRDRSLVNIGPALKGYPMAELEVVVSEELQHFQNSELEPCAEGSVDGPVRLEELDFRIWDLGRNETGFLGADLECTEPTTVYLLFDEILSNGDVDWKRLGCVNAVTYELAPGAYALESLEPYTARYVKVLVAEGACSVNRLYMRELAHPAGDRGFFECSSEALNTIFDAGLATFKQNSLDVFMDCPSRERAGWLCDSFFTARVEADLWPTSPVEANFFENFLVAEEFKFLPEGMLPMCYPADHNDGVFIPNWSMWFVVQLEEYLDRSGNRELLDALEPRVMALLDYFARFENSDGLLEKLESWVFVEWSAANNFVQDINYPSNMLYSGVLSAAGRMYDRQELLEKAERVRRVIREQSYDGSFFVDNAMRKPEGIEVTRNRTEVCQYFAFFFEVATPDLYPELWARLADEFGPDRMKAERYPEIHVANSFIGNMLRFELLSRHGRGAQIMEESIGYLSYMAEQTGTLWENTGAYASCNHGFASHIVHTLYRDGLGLQEVDKVGKRVVVRRIENGLEWCRGGVPTVDGLVRVWTEAKPGGVLEQQVRVPEGWTVEWAR